MCSDELIVLLEKPEPIYATYIIILSWLGGLVDIIFISVKKKIGKLCSNFSKNCFHFLGKGRHESTSLFNYE